MARSEENPAPVVENGSHCGGLMIWCKQANLFPSPVGLSCEATAGADGADTPSVDQPTSKFEELQMPWVVTRLCQDNVDTACVAECPVDCFYKPTGGGYKNQLYISPDECIDCGACEPACPWEAIFQDDSVPSVFQDDIALNVKCDEDRDNFETAENNPDTHKPSPEEVSANKQKHGYA